MATRLYPRLLESIILEALTDTPAVCLLGARQVGKTTLARQLKPKRQYITFDDRDNLRAAQTDPLGFVEGLDDKVILDEVQRVPELLPAIKQFIDQNRRKKSYITGKFLLTGSANLLLIPKVQESLAGRMEVVHLQPLSEMEKHRNSTSLLYDLLEGRIKTRMTQRKKVTGIAEAVCSGGYPEPLERSGTRARQWYRSYLQSIIQRDIQDIAQIRDQKAMTQFIELMSYRTGGLLNTSNIAKELRLTRVTVEKYFGILERLYLIRRLPAWHINQAKRLIKASKVHIIDSGLASALNRIDPSHWANPSGAFGHLLESFVIQQFICQSGWVDPELRFYHYRDKDQIEVDLVIERGRDVWGVEVKQAQSIQDSDAAGLNRLALQAGKSFRGGILLYAGNRCLPVRVTNTNSKCFAVPLDRLWRGIS